MKTGEVRPNFATLYYGLAGKLEGDPSGFICDSKVQEDLICPSTIAGQIIWCQNYGINRQDLTLARNLKIALNTVNAVDFWKSFARVTQTDRLEAAKTVAAAIAPILRRPGIRSEDQKKADDEKLMEIRDLIGAALDHNESIENVKKRRYRITPATNS